MNDQFRRVFDEQYDYVWRSLRRLGVQERDLEDVAHEVFLEIHAQLPRYDEARPIRPWLFAFVVRFASDYRKLARHKTDLRSDPALNAIATSPSAEDVIDAKDNARALQAALNELSMELRAVIVLYELDEVSMKDISEALGIPLFTAYSRLRLAREQCAEVIRRLRAEEGARPR